MPFLCVHMGSPLAVWLDETTGGSSVNSSWCVSISCGERREWGLLGPSHRWRVFLSCPRCSQESCDDLEGHVMVCTEGAPPVYVGIGWGPRGPWVPAGSVCGVGGQRMLKIAGWNPACLPSQADGQKVQYFTFIHGS